MSGNITAKVLFDFKARKKEELDLKKGETIVDVKMVNKEWVRGSNSQGQSGCFPANYVVIIDPNNVKKRVTAKYDFDGKGDKISFKKGENIDVLAEISADWWTGINASGQTGLFPANYVTDMVKGSKPLSGTQKFTREDVAKAQADAAAAKEKETASRSSSSAGNPPAASRPAKQEEVFTSATLKDFPITFSMPRKNIPFLGLKYAKEEGPDAKKAREACKAKLEELSKLV